MMRLLELLTVPRSVPDLSRMTGYSEGSVRHMLEILKRRGYATDAGCGSACGVCPLRNLCPSTGGGDEIWMITESGREYLGSRRAPNPSP